MSNRDFQKEMQGIFSNYHVKSEKKIEPVEPVKKVVVAKTSIGPIFNIHKRSLPVGLDKVILWNLIKIDADRWLLKLKPILIDEEKRIVHYYEKVRQDGFKGGVFDNDLPSLTKDEEPEVEIILDDVKWKG